MKSPSPHTCNFSVSIMGPSSRLAPKRGKATKRVTIHTVSILPQLEVVLKRVLDKLIEVHRRIHVDGCNRLRTETSYFPAYEADIETFLEFLSQQIRVVLTINFDGVVFKKLTRSQAWPIYIRLEGLPYRMKNNASNMLIAGVMFLRKTPTETLLKELFSVLKEELGMLEGGIDIESATTVWKCFPVIKYGVIDFEGLHTIYKCPRWQSHQGCHLCVATGERIERSFCWYIPIAPLLERRTYHSIIRDAAAHQNGLQGTTQMMDLLTMERCRVDALHAISEGVTCDLFRELFGSRNRVPELKMNRESILLLRGFLESTRNITYANKFVLGMQDLSRCTASEKDAVASVAFPVIAAKLLCDPIGCAAVLCYWSLTQALQNREDWNIETISETKDLALAMKRLWSRVSKQLFTLKLHCLIDHAIVQDLEYSGTPYQWSAAPFERMHRVLQIRHTQNATNCEELLLKNFLLNREFSYKMDVESPTTSNESFERLSSVMSHRGQVNRFPVACVISDSWYIPSNSEIDTLNLNDQHAAEIDEYLRRGYTLSQSSRTRSRSSRTCSRSRQTGVRSRHSHCPPLVRCRLLRRIPLLRKGLHAYSAPARCLWWM